MVRHVGCLMPIYSYDFDGHYGGGYVFGDVDNGEADTITLTFTENLSASYGFVNIYGDTDGPADVFNVVLPEGWQVVLNFTNEMGANDQHYFYVMDDTGAQRMQFAITGDLVVPCFTRGAVIQTPSGPVPIENLVEGNLVLTRDNQAQPIRWIGSSLITGEMLNQFPELRPVRIGKDALGANCEQLLSPAHRVLLTGWRAETLFGENEILATAKSLINDQTISIARDVTKVEYFHILFDNHEIINADGAWSESFHPDALHMGSTSAATRDEVLTIFPELETSAEGYETARMTVQAADVQVLGF